VRVIVMGVSGSGKSTLGEALAAELDLPFIEGDRFHPSENVAKMSAGIPLTDADRWPWLERLGAELVSSSGAVASCSALRRIYRDRLRAVVGPGLRFVCLIQSRPELERRMGSRQGHFMPAGLLDSQLAAFEPPTEERDVMIAAGPSSLRMTVERAAAWIRRCKS
jgi:gluconokinase